MRQEARQELKQANEWLRQEFQQANERLRQLELRQVLGKIEERIQENSVKLSTLTDQLEDLKETFTNWIEMAENLAASAKEKAVNVSSECKKLGDRLAALEDGSRRMEISWQILLVTVGTMGVGLPCAFSLAAHWIYGWPNKPGYTRYLEAFKPSWRTCWKRQKEDRSQSLMDIPFGRHGNKLDLYYPSRVEELALTPALVFVYGGAWGSGQKSTYCLLAIQMAKQLNKIVICPDYSTYPKGTVMEMVQDVLDCVLWIKENACAFNIHKENIVLMGHSAGAHLCALSVLLLAEESSELNIDHVKQRDLLSSIKAVVGLSGVYHILDHYLHETWRGIEYLSTMCKAMKDPDYFDHYSPTLLISSLRAEKLTRVGLFFKKPLKMNMVKRIMGRPRQEECSPQDNALGLMHLRRLFSELCHPPRHMTQKEQEEKLYMMLPVFNRVFGSAPPSTMTEKFSDLLQFTTQVSRLMVTEIRRRASNKSTEAASRAIVQFLEVNQSEEASRGWMLLTTINLLASSGQKTVDCMTTMSVPSTLVKCLYLFFDLPHVPDVPGASQTEVPLADRRALLQKVFVQILVKLCSFVSPAEELAQKDDLQLLFSAITSWCPPHNLPWRKSAGEVLMTISRHGLSVNVVKYIHEKECLATCIQNMQQSDDLSPLEIVEMFAGLSCFLKDSSDVSQTLLDDFRLCQGYTFLCDLMLRLEQAKEDDSKDALKDLVNLVTSLTTYGVGELKTTGVTTGAPFLLPGFAVPQPAGKGHTVRNIQAFSVLQNAFLKAKTSRLTQFILDAISNIYLADNANYFILESQHTLSQFAEKISKLAEAQTKYFELLEFVVFSLNYIPCKELFSVSVLLKSSTSYQCSITAMRTLLKFTRHDPIFRDVFREVGLMEVMVNLLHKYAALLKDPTQGPNEQAVFREFGGARCVHNIVKYPQCREQALMIIQQLVLSPSGDDDMGTLLGLMHSAPPTELQLKTDILRALLVVLRESHRTRTVFRKVGGFVYVTSLLVAMERSLCCPPKSGWEKVNQNQVFELLHMVFCTLTAAMRYEPANSHFFRTEIQYEKLADAVRLLGCFSDSKKISPATVFPSNSQPFQRMLEDDLITIDSVSPTLRHCSKLFIYLYKMATDSFDRWIHLGPPFNPSPPPRGYYNWEIAITVGISSVLKQKMTTGDQV
ncbi:WDFY3 protein, partial [Polypterus senegalus]